MTRAACLPCLPATLLALALAATIPPPAAASDGAALPASPDSSVTGATQTLPHAASGANRTAPEITVTLVRWPFT